MLIIQDQSAVILTKKDGMDLDGLQKGLLCFLQQFDINSIDFFMQNAENKTPMSNFRGFIR